VVTQPSPKLQNALRGNGRGIMKKKSSFSYFKAFQINTLHIQRCLAILKAISIMTFLALACSACDSKNQPYLYLFDPQNIAFVVGSEFDDIGRIDSYKQLFFFYVDFNNNLYVGDLQGLKIDKYNKYGQYVVSFGRAGQGPGEFDSNIPMFCADSNEFLFAATIKCIDVYNPKGEYIDKIDYSQEMRNWYCVMIKADHSDNLLLAMNSDMNEFKLIKLNRKSKKYITIHYENKRSGTYNNTLCRFIPGFEVDQHDNIYVLDTSFYKVFKYAPDGNLIKTYEKNISRKKMSKKELRFTSFNKEILTLPEKFFNQLEGDAKYYPILCGINIDNNKIFLWRTEQDHEYKRIIDIYDVNFRLIGRSSFYNAVYFNSVYIRNDFIYFPNIGDEDISYKKQLGILGVYRLPTKIMCYKYREQ